MTHDDFRELVRRMREAQRRYYQSRYGTTRVEALEEARRLEAEVDAAIGRGGMESMFGGSTK